MSRTIDGTFTAVSKNSTIQQVRPYDFGTDAIERQRVSLGQSLIDADFEYGIQPTKWQTHQEIRKTPSFFEIPGTDLVITDVVSDGYAVSNIYVGTTSALPPVGSVITVNGISNYGRTSDRAEGFFLVSANATTPGSFLSLPSNTFTYFSKGEIAAGQMVTPSTTIRRGSVFNGGNCKISITQITQNSNLVTVFTSNVHGMMPGTPLCSNNWSGSGVVGCNGNFFVEGVPKSNSFIFSSVVAAAGSTVPSGGSIFVQPYSTVTHRPFDGGVLLTPLVCTHGAMVCRQSKKVFRYQSGKGLLWSSGTLFCPNNDIARVIASGTAIGSNITVQTDVYHGAQVGATIQLRGILTTGYNGTYTVNSVNDSKSVNVIATTTLGATIAAFQNQPRFILSKWHGSSARAGCFDDQNGLFWEWDGQTLWAVKRSSTFQLAGTVITAANGQTLVGNTYTDSLISTVTYGSLAITFPTTVNIGDVSTQVTVTSTAGLIKGMHVISGFYPGYIDTAYVVSVDSLTAFTIGFAPITVQIPFGNKTGNVTFLYPTTRFQEQLKVGDKFVMRGMTHTVTAILSQGVLNFNPPYRGILAPTVPIKASRVIDIRTNQSNFNRDTLDGLGASGYKVDVTKMQMIGLQYTWYGAGFVDFMMRGSDGNWVFAHRIRNNNVNDEAYMRTGNLPVRYELINEMSAAVSTLNGQISTTTSNIILNDDTTYWPPAGIILVDSELMYYSSKGSFALNGITRATSFNYVINDSPRTFTASTATSHADKSTVLLTSITVTPSLTHWGSAFLMDGSFDQDRGYYFNYSNIYTANITTTQSVLTAVPLFALRLAPSVSNGIIGNIGDRDLMNRAQLLLQKMEVTGNQTLNLIGVMNPQGFTNINWTPINSIQNQGQPSFCQVSNSFTYNGNYQGGERIFSTIAAGGATNVIDLTNLKELTGGVIGGPNFSPDGPDTLVLYAGNAGTSNITNLIVNLFWSEAQA